MTDTEKQIAEQMTAAKKRLFDFIDCGGKDYGFLVKKIKNYGLGDKYVNPARLCAMFKNIYLTTPTSRSGGQTIRDCHPSTIVNALLKCAEWGLEPSNELAHLIPRKGILCAQLGYRGKVELCSRAGIRLTAHNIFQNDEFSHAYGNNKFLVHKPNWLNKGVHVGSYGFALFEGGDFDFRVLSLADMEPNKKASQSKLWQTHPEQMYRKTAIHVHYNYLPANLKDSRVIEEEGNGIIIDNDIVDKFNLDVDKFNLDTDVMTIDGTTPNIAPDTADILIGELV
jgi:phage RecT family recombinase